MNDQEVTTKHQLYPACLPLQPRTSNEAIHSGWSKQIPYQFLEKNAPGFAKIYDEFFKQQVRLECETYYAKLFYLVILQQYKMDVMEKCEDPNNYDPFGFNVTYPTNPYFPPGISPY